MTNLRRRGQTWYVSVRVPPSLQPPYQSSHVVRSLKTRDLDAAVRLKHQVVADIRREFEKARQGAVGEASPRSREQEARRIFDDMRRAMRTARTDDEVEQVDAGISAVLDDYLRRTDDEEGAMLIGRAGSLDFEPLADTLDGFLDTQRAWERTEKTIMQHREACQRLIAFLPKLATARDVDGRTAGRFVHEVLVPDGTSIKTKNRRLSSLSSWWRWLIKQQHADVNPWQGHALRRGKRASDQDSLLRPYSDAELVTLLQAPATGVHARALPDLLRLGLLTGCRLEELCRLTVGAVDLDAGFVTIREGKSKAARRSVPIRDELRPLLIRRLKGKSGKDYLIEELEPGGPDGRRSEAFTKAFTRWRRRNGVGVDEEGTDTGQVNFHSLRRNMATALRRGGVAESTAANIIGHEVPTMTFGTYEGAGLEPEQLKAAMDAARFLPEVLALI